MKPSTGTSLTNKKTTPPTVGKISKPKSFKVKSKTLSSKLTSTSSTPQNAKKELSTRKSSNKKNKKLSPELNLGLKIEKILENGGPNVIRLSSEHETPKTSIVKKKKVKKEGSETQTSVKKVRRTKRDSTDNNELSNEEEFSTPAPKKKMESAVKTGDNEIPNHQEEKKKVKLINRSKRKIETEPSSPDIASQSNQGSDEDSGDEEVPVYAWEAPSQFNLELDKVVNAVNALKQRTKTKFEKKQMTELFDSNTEPIYLQVVTVKKATCPKRMLRFTLPHPLVHDLTDVCLIVQNIRGHRSDNDWTIEYYEDLLKKNNVTEIKEIITAKMVTEEYAQYEMKRKLRDRFDIFLADSRISHFLVKDLGKFFAYTKKHPIPVRLSEGNVKENISNALRKTQMKISPDSDMFSALVGHMGQTSEEIAANVYAVAEELVEQLPGNWPNVRALYVMSSGIGKGFPLPVYISLLTPNKVPVPVMEPPKKKGDIIVEDELSTMLDARVKVMPDGTVHVLREKTRKSSLSDAEDEEILAIAEKHKKEARSSHMEDEEHSKPKKKSEKIVQEAEEKFVQFYKGNLDDIDIDEEGNENDDNESIASDNLPNDGGDDDDDNDDDDDDVDDAGNAENGMDNSVDDGTTNKLKKRKSPAAHPIEVKKAKKTKKTKQLILQNGNDDEDDDHNDGDGTERKVKQKKPKDERVAKTNWIKSTKKAGSKKLSKSQRKAKIKTKNLKKK